MIRTTPIDEDSDAEVGGELVTNDAGCAGISRGDTFYPVLWPEGTSVSEEGLTFPDGTSVEPGGTWSGSGGEGFLPAENYPDIPEECVGSPETMTVVANTASGS
ncbi:hypothetical protein ACFS27_26835 [Promicromonospora vindobonensis]|uniref:Uncharacterized protein n=1 Tax=Promicromonospora vindobonensis TaxID=195748 RepID=A0ABW5VZW9_9MICO